MSNIFEEQNDFMAAAGQPYGVEGVDLYLKLVAEEALEVSDAALCPECGDIELVKELCDVIYVAAGALNALFNGNSAFAGRAFDAVHKSNLSKVLGGGVVTYDADGKVMKNEEYKKVAKAILYDKLRELML